MSIYELNCPFCAKAYRLPREKVVKHVGKTIFCRGCGQPFAVPPLPAFEASDSQTDSMNGGIIAAGAAPLIEERAVTEEPQAASSSVAVASEEAETSHENEQLPPPFSAEVLPSISDVLPAIDEPPEVELPHIGDDGDDAYEAEPSAFEDEPMPYRSGREHGALAVEEAPIDVDSNGSVVESHVELMLPLPDPPTAYDDQEDDLAPSPAPVEYVSIRPTASLAIGEPPAELPAPRRPRNIAAIIPPNIQQLPPGIDLSSVPIARAAPPPPVVSIDLAPLKRRMAWVIALSVVIILLLITNLLATLGYFPHHI